MTESKTSLSFSPAISEILLNLFGPVSEEIGKGWQERVSAKRRKKTEQIIQNAATKLGDKLEVPGAVPLRVVKEVINEGSYNDNPVAVEYYGGVLASSRTEDGQDDRGAVIAKSIERLSVYDIRTHYLIYATIHQLFRGSEKSLLLAAHRNSMCIYIGITEYDTVMGFKSGKKRNAIMSTSLFGLAKGSFLADVSFGNTEALRKETGHVYPPGIIIQPSFHGAELFLYAFGMGDVSVGDFLKTDFKYDIEGIPKGFQNAQIVGK